MDYDFSGPLQPQDLFGREYVTMGGVIDHHLTTTMQSPLKMPKKPVVTTNNGLFPVLAANVQNQQILRFNVCLRRPAVVLRPGRPEVRILPVAPNNENPNLFSIGEGFGFFVLDSFSGGTTPSSAGESKKDYIVKRPSGIMKVRSANCTNRIPGGLLKWKKISQVCSTQHGDASIM